MLYTAIAWYARPRRLEGRALVSRLPDRSAHCRRPSHHTSSRTLCGPAHASLRLISPPPATARHRRWDIRVVSRILCILPLTPRSGFAPRSLIVATAANKAEVSTSNLRSGASFDNLKASWGKKLCLGDFNSQLDCSYDYNENKEFLKDAKVQPPPRSAQALLLLGSQARPSVPCRLAT